MRAWRELVGSAKARTLSSGIITIISEVINRLARTNVFVRADAFEYLANSQEAWFPPDQEDDTEKIQSLIERLDTTVLGLIEALDSDSADLPRLLDEALTGSLWSRQIARQVATVRSNQLWLLQARARLMWNKSTSSQRRGAFAMGVGLEAGLAIDAIAGELTALLDAAEHAALSGNLTNLSAAFIGLAERMFEIRPFVPDVELPPYWRDLLTAWLAGTAAVQLGPDNMRVIEDAFVYRLVWALEAVRMRRRTTGETSDIIEGGAAATLEAGLPQAMMAMLVRAGLPSRVAAMTAVRDGSPAFVTTTDMNLWLRSNQVVALTDQLDWPTADTAAIWKQFRTDALAGSTSKWVTQDWTLPGSIAVSAGSGPGRVHIAPDARAVTVTTPDYKLVYPIQQRLQHFSPALFYVEYAPDRQSSRLVRMGRGEAQWENAQ